MFFTSISTKYLLQKKNPIKKCFFLMVVEIYFFLKTSFSWSCFLYKDFCKIHDTTAFDRC